MEAEFKRQNLLKRLSTNHLTEIEDKKEIKEMNLFERGFNALGNSDHYLDERVYGIMLTKEGRSRSKLMLTSGKKQLSFHSGQISNS